MSWQTDGVVYPLARQSAFAAGHPGKAAPTDEICRMNEEPLEMGAIGAIGPWPVHLSYRQDSMRRSAWVRTSGGGGGPRREKLFAGTLG